MLKRDFIMIQIEELAKVVLQIIMNRNTNAARHTPELIQTIYSSLKLDRPTLMTAQPEELVRRLDSLSTIDYNEYVGRIGTAHSLIDNQTFNRYLKDIHYFCAVKVNSNGK